jgi:hypothetical protein
MASGYIKTKRKITPMKGNGKEEKGMEKVNKRQRLIIIMVISNTMSGKEKECIHFNSLRFKRKGFNSKISELNNSIEDNKLLEIKPRSNIKRSRRKKKTT